MLDNQTIEKKFEGIVDEVVQTTRTISDYATGMGCGPREFTQQYLSGKLLADVGSGGGGLAIDTALHQINCTVYSINPSLDAPSYHRGLAAGRKSRFNDVSQKDYERAMSIYEEHTVCAYAHELLDQSELKRLSGMFDVVFDSVAVTEYFLAGSGRLEQYQELYTKSLEQMLLLLNPGGSLIIETESLDFFKDNPLFNQILRSPHLPIGEIRKIYKGSSHELIAMEIVRK